MNKNEDIHKSHIITNVMSLWYLNPAIMHDTRAYFKKLACYIISSHTLAILNNKIPGIIIPE